MNIKEVVISRFVAGDYIAQGSVGVATPNPYDFTFGGLKKDLIHHDQRRAGYRDHQKRARNEDFRLLQHRSVPPFVAEWSVRVDDPDTRHKASGRKNQGLW